MGAVALGLGLLPLTVPASAAAAPASPGAASGTWTIQPSPNKPGAIANVLSAVSCVKNGPCEAVGTYTLSTGVPRHQFALILKGSGGTWVREPTPTIKGAGYSLLSGVSCTSASSCFAVGYTVSQKNGTTVVAPLAERWNGTSWTLDSPPKIAGSSPWGVLDDVSCLGPSFCLAVGGYIKNLTGSGQEQPLAEEWNGTVWTQLTAPNPHAENGSEFTSVDCVAASRCQAVGDYGFADVDLFIIAYSLNGIAWTAQKPVNPGGQSFNSANSVSCTSASACTMAGLWSPSQPLGLAQRWNGATWSRQRLPEPPNTVTDELTGVSCTAAAACTAVGNSATNPNDNPTAPMAMTWNGTSWQLATTTDPAGGGGLNSVSCTSPTTCVAVGAAGASTLVEVSPSA